MNDKADIGPVELRLSATRVYEVNLTGAHIKLIHDVLNNAHFKGSECFVVAEAIRQLQEAPMLEAHGATTPSISQD